MNEIYKQYIRQYSSETIEYDQALFLISYLIKRRPQKLVEYGSGFTSYLFHVVYSENINPNATIYSIDHSQFWAKRTEQFINQYAIGKYILCVSRMLPLLDADFIFFDYKETVNRHKSLEQLMQYNTRAEIILTGAEDRKYTRRVFRLCMQYGWIYESLIDQTSTNGKHFAKIYKI